MAIKYKFEDGSIFDTSGYSQNELDDFLELYPSVTPVEKEDTEDGEDDKKKKKGAAKKDADVVPVATSGRASAIMQANKKNTDSSLETTSSELPKDEVIEDEVIDPVKPLPTYESFIPKEAYSKNQRGSTKIDYTAQEIAREKYAAHYKGLSKVKTDVTGLKLEAVIAQYNNAYADSEGFDFVQEGGRGVTVTAPNGESKTFDTTVGARRRARGNGSSTQQWAGVQEFIERNKDSKSAAKHKKASTEIQSRVYDIIRGESYRDKDGDDPYVKDTEDIQQNHPDIVEKIREMAIEGYNEDFKSDAGLGFLDRLKMAIPSLGSPGGSVGLANLLFGSSDPLDMTGISDYKIDKAIANAYTASVLKDKEDDDIELWDTIKSKSNDLGFDGDLNKLSDWAIRGAVRGINDPVKKTIAASWEDVYKVRNKLQSSVLPIDEKIKLQKEKDRLTKIATDLSNDHFGSDHKIMFNTKTKTTSNVPQGEEGEGVDITPAVLAERERLLNLKSGDFNAVKNQFSGHRINYLEMQKKLKDVYTIKIPGQPKPIQRTLEQIISQHHGLGTANFKEVTKTTGGEDATLTERDIERLAGDYLDLKAHDIAFTDMFLLNVDPSSMKRSGFFSSFYEGFLESVMDEDSADFLSGFNDSDILNYTKEIGVDAGIEGFEYKDIFKETLRESVGYTSGGLPVLAGEFAAANFATGGAASLLGLDLLLGGYRTGKYFQKGYKTAMKLDDVVAAAAKDGYKGGIASKGVQKWVSMQDDIVKVGGGKVDNLKALFIDSQIEGIKTEMVLDNYGTGAIFLPAARLTGKLGGALGLNFKAKGHFHKLNDLVINPTKAGLGMVLPAEGAAVVEAAIEDFAGGEDFGTFMDKNFNDVEWLGEGGIYRRLLGHAVAGAGLSLGHLNPKNLTKTINGQKKLAAKSLSEMQIIAQQMEANKKVGTEEGKKENEEVLTPKLSKVMETYQLTQQFIGKAYDLNVASDPEQGREFAFNDFNKAMKAHKADTGKDLDITFKVNMDGTGMGGDAAKYTKNPETGKYSVEVDARFYHKGILDHELGHVYGDLFGINNEADLGKIVGFIKPLVKKHVGVDIMEGIEANYEKKEQRNEEYLMALVEMLGKDSSSGLVKSNAYGEIAKKVSGLFKKKMDKAFDGKPPILNIETPQQLLDLLQGLSKGIGKDGQAKQFEALKNLYLKGNKVFNGKSKTVEGSYSSKKAVEAQIADILFDQKRIAKIPAAERTAEDAARLKSNVDRIKALKAQPSTTETKKSDKEIEIFHGGTVKTVKDVNGNIYFSESKEQASYYTKGNGGKVAKFKIKESEIASEAKVFEVIRELGIQPKIEGWTVDDSRLYELLDNRFDNAFSKADLGKLNEALAKKGIKASRFTDSDMRTGKDTENIVVFDKSLLDTNIDSKFNQIKALEKESKELAEKYGKDVIKSTKQTRLENELLEELKDPIGKLVTSRTKALFDPIAEDARAGVTREKFQDSMRSDLTAMILNEYKPGAQPIEKFIINRGYLRANNLAQRLGIKSAKDGIDKGMEAAEKVAAAEVTSNEKEAVTIEPVNKLIRDPELKAEFIKEIKDATKDLDPEQVNYKTLIDKAPELTKKVFGEVLKPNGKVDKAKTKQMQQQFIRNNASTIYKLLPEGARKFATGLKTATGIQPGLLKNFYEVGERAAMNEGTAAGLKSQIKKPFNEAAFLEVFGANKGQEPNRNHQTAIDALIKEVGKAMTNRTYRQALEDTDISMNTIQKIADGKSINMASKGGNIVSDIITDKIGDTLYKAEDTESNYKTYKAAISTITRDINKYFGELAPEMKNSAKKRNVTLEQVVEERLISDASWRSHYEKNGLEYRPIKEVANNEIAANGKTHRDNFVEGMKLLVEAFPDAHGVDAESMRAVITSTIGVNGRVPIDGKIPNQKNLGVTGGEALFSKLINPTYKKGSTWRGEDSPYRYAFVPSRFGKGVSKKTEVGGTGFNGTIEKGLLRLKKKYNGDTGSPKFREEYMKLTRDLLTHPELRGTADGYELTVSSNLMMMKKAYTTLYDAVAEGKITKSTAADLLRVQTNHATGIFKALVPFEGMTLGEVGRYKKGKGKNTHNEHMIELLNYNLSFMGIVNSGTTRENAVDAINEMVEGLGQSVIDVPTQKLKDSAKFRGPSAQVFKHKVLNTFLKTGSLDNSLIIYGPNKGKTQAEAMFEELGVDGIRNMLMRVPKHRRQVQWKVMEDALSEIEATKMLASKEITADFTKIIAESTGITGEMSDIAAKQAAGSKGKYKLFVSASADDFVGLMNYNAGKGKQGEGHQAFFKEKLYDPYAEAYRQINNDNVDVARQFKDIKRHVSTNAPKFKLRTKIEGSKFTLEQALRATIWDSQGMEVPGISPAELKMLKNEVNSSVPLSVLKLNLKRIAKGEYHKPGKNWYAGDIASDLRAGLSTTLRSKRLETWKENVDAMFTPETLNKLEAAHGTPYRKALEGMLDAMYTGRSRRSSASSLEGRTLNYLNNSVGTIMFLNQRSATMQLTSAFNYINWHDNNPIKAGAAVANIPQYAKDIKTLFTSDWAKSRRQGLRINVTESEIADAVTGSENTPKSIVSLLLKKGFAPTQIADAVATAVGGASLYRNRIKRYVKEGMDSVEAEKQAMQDWVEISETNQQSSRPDKVSMQQRSDLGKLVLAFANTPMQYMRESKKAILDLKNGRGDKKTHLSKIAYYSIIQSAAFSAMQQAMFKMAWSDDEQDELWLKNKGPKVLNSMADGALRGMGYGGAIVSMIKNTGLELAKQNEYGYKGKLENAAWKLLDVSPPVSSKISKIRYSFKNIDRAGGFEKAKKLPLSLDNPFIKSAAGVTEAVANVPTARLLSKITNLSELANAESQWYEKMMIMAGWKKWEIEAERDFDKKKSKKKKKKTYGTGSIKTKSY